MDDFQLLELTAEYAHFRFSGLFMERDVLYEVQLHAKGKQGTAESRQFMEVEPSQSGAVVEVSLDLAIPEVTESEIRKTIIMLRNYKQLKPGRHEWSG